MLQYHWKQLSTKLLKKDCMKKIQTAGHLMLRFMAVMACVLIATAGEGQQLNMKAFIVFGGGPSCANCGVTIGGSQITSGAIGSYRNITTTSGPVISGNLHSGGTIVLANTTSVGGNITVGNDPAVPGNALQIGSNAFVGGNIEVNGNALVVSNAIIQGHVRHPDNTVYSGPVPGGAEILATPQVPAMPVFPVITNGSDFPAGNNPINNTREISAGAYGDVKLTGGRTLTFKGPGTYIFKSIKNSGATNNIVFDFMGQPGNIILLVHENVDLGKSSVSIAGGGSATRIFAEVLGNGTGSFNGRTAWNMAQGSSSTNEAQWQGTIWAPNGDINIGSGANASKVLGAMISRFSVVVGGSILLTHAPFEGCDPQFSAGPDREVNCENPTTQLQGSLATVGATFNWQALDGGVILSGGATLTPTVSKAGTYVLTATNPACNATATDTVIVTYDPCVIPYYPPPNTGKVLMPIGAELYSLYINSDTYEDVPQNIFITSNDSVMIEVIAIEGQYQTLLALLQTPDYGLTDIISNGQNTLLITGKYPIANLLKLNDLPQLINYCRPVYAPLLNGGLTQTAGDTSMHAHLARLGYNLTGAGFKVGVISDSYNKLPNDPAGTDVLNKDLPGPGNAANPVPVHVLKDYPVRRSDEGRAMLQIVHDVAPGAALAFRTGFISAGDFAEGIRELYEDSCQVIVDDVTFITEPFFQDGVVSKAVDFVKSKGVSYFSAAGNFGKKSYESFFLPAPAPAGFTGSAHNFGGGDVEQRLNLVPGVYTIVLQWYDDIYSLGQTQTGTLNDLDIYLRDENGGTFGFNRDNSGGDPLEVLPFTVTANTSSSIMIIRASGSTNVRFKYVIFRGEAVIAEYHSGYSTIVGQANAAGAMAIGAVLYSNTPAYGNPMSVASFSSRGGTPVYVNGVPQLRNKPELLAPNGVNTTVPFGSINVDGDAFPNFFGTSAAAPHAAAVAALLQQARSKYYEGRFSPDEIRVLLQQSAIDLNTDPVDDSTGAGLIQADAALRHFLMPTPILDSFVFTDPNIVIGATTSELLLKGKFFTSGSQVYFNDVLLGSVVNSSTQITVQIPPFNDEGFIKIYNPPISPSGDDGGYSQTLSLFSVAKRVVTVVAHDTAKKWAEEIPSFQVSVLVNGDSLQHTNFTLADLGLGNILFETPATPTSNVGNYFIRPYRNFDPANPADAELLSKYEYVFVNGLLTVERLPVTVVARDTTLFYGQKLGNFHYDYQLDASLNITNLAALTNQISTAHQDLLAQDVVAIANGQPVAIINGQPVAILNGLRSGQPVAILNGEPLVMEFRSGQPVAILNGQPVPILNAQQIQIINGQPVAILNVLANGQPVAILNGQPVAIINGQPVAILNGILAGQPVAILNGQPVAILNSMVESDVADMGFMVSAAAVQQARPLVNTYTLPGGSTVTETTNVIDFARQSIYDYNINPQTNTTVMINSIAQVNTRGILDAEQIVNGQPVAILNGQPVAILNGQPVAILNGQPVAILNGQPVAILNSLTDDNKLPVIIDQSDVTSTVQGPSGLKSIAIVSGFHTGVHYIIPGAMLNDNLQIRYEEGELRILPVPLTIEARDATKNFGEALTLDGAQFDITSGSLMYGDGIAGLQLSSAGAAAGAGAGHYPIVPQGAIGTKGTNLTNYAITFVNGNLEVSRAALTIRANDRTKVYGSALNLGTSAYTITSGTLAAGHSISSVTLASAGAAASATVTAPGPQYAITASNATGTGLSNYNITYVPGALTVSKAPFNAAIGTYVIFQNDPLPNIQVVKTGLVNGDAATFTVQHQYTGSAGVYPLVPQATAFAKVLNYDTTHTDGLLYVNPKGPGAKKLRPGLDCVQETPGALYPFIAHFIIVNDNPTPVYVAIGPDNRISSTGSFDASAQPIIFMPGTTRFSVPFDGVKLSYELKTYETNKKTSVASVASSTSGRCSNTFITTARMAAAAEPLDGGAAIQAFPNPAGSRLRITLRDAQLLGATLELVDDVGRTRRLTGKPLSPGSLELDVSSLKRGAYFIRVPTSEGVQVTRFIKL